MFFNGVLGTKAPFWELGGIHTTFVCFLMAFWGLKHLFGSGFLETGIHTTFVWQLWLGSMIFSLGLVGFWVFFGILVPFIHFLLAIVQYGAFASDFCLRFHKRFVYNC